LASLPRLRTLLVFARQLEWDGRDAALGRIAAFPALAQLLVDISPRSLVGYDDPLPDAPPPALEQALREQLPHVSVQWLRVH
jgi:hypothetical protein